METVGDAQEVSEAVAARFALLHTTPSRVSIARAKTHQRPREPFQWCQTSKCSLHVHHCCIKTFQNWPKSSSIPASQSIEKTWSGDNYLPLFPQYYLTKLWTRSQGSIQKDMSAWNCRILVIFGRATNCLWPVCRSRGAESDANMAWQDSKRS